MNRFKGRLETSKKGFVPVILEHADHPQIAFVLDNSYVEYGTGCWLSKVTEEPAAEGVDAQETVWALFNGEVPQGYFVFNTCNDYRVCYNPGCLDLLEIVE